MNALTGELSFASVPALLRGLAATDELDLAAVTRTDSAGLSFLLELTRRAHARSQTLIIRNASDQVRGLALFFGVDSLLNFQ